MNRCPITYEPCNNRYSLTGIKKISRRLSEFNDLEFSAKELRQEAAIRATRISIQGAQPKLSSIINIKDASFDLVNINGKYILKPQHDFFSELPQNEDLTMKMAKACGIEVPFHGMVYSKDESLTYFIKRFDRSGRNNKVALEDFAQLSGHNRETKYKFSVEKLIVIIDDYCTFPVIEKAKFFKRFLFNFLCGNEDMHLKNYSLIIRNNIIELSPAYDFLNSSIVLKGDVEETALTLRGKKKNLTRKILVEYLGKERMSLNNKVIANVLFDLENALTGWFKLLEISFLSGEMKELFYQLLKDRIHRLGLD